MQVHNGNTNGTAGILAAIYLSRKPGLMTNEQSVSHLSDRIIDEQRQTEDLLVSTRIDDASVDYDQPGIVHFSKTHVADAELDADGGIHLVPVRAKNKE